MKHQMNLTIYREANIVTLNAECSSKLSADKIQAVLEKVISRLKALSESDY